MTTKRIRVHLGLTRALQARLKEAGQHEIEAFAKRLGLENVNSKRLDRFGMLTGDVLAARAEALRSEDGVDFVEEDSVKTAI